MLEFTVLGYGLAGVLFGLLAVLLLVGWRSRFHAGPLLGAALASGLWAAIAALHALEDLRQVELVWASEVIRNLLWMLFLLRLLQPLAANNLLYGRVLGYVRFGSLLLGMLLLAMLAEIPVLRDNLPPAEVQREFSLIGQLLYAVLGMVLVEQLFRNTPEERRWGIKYLCFGLGMMFVYDFYLYTDALLFHRLDADIWSARGAVNAMIVPLLAVAATRNPDWRLPVFLSRRMVFHSTTLFGAGIYMLLMALAGYYIKAYGGQWGTVLQITFFFGAVTILAALLFSGQLRARAKVFLNKHFFTYRYDYREEWLRLMDLLAGRQAQLPLYERVIWAISEIADSPGGALWLANDKGQYHCVAYFNLGDMGWAPVSGDQPVLEFMSSRHWIVDLDEMRRTPEMYDGIAPPDWSAGEQSLWLLVPLLQDGDMLGFVMLTEPRAHQAINWEDRDLLKTAGSQAASYIALHQAAEALADARQFEGFNRLSAFVIHDLKNLIAQLSLVAKNAAKHKRNPDFVDDAVRTIENSVAKMNRLMVQLKTADASGGEKTARIELVSELRAVVESRAGSKPQPVFVPEVAEMMVSGQEDRLGAVFGHVLQNALDATPADGSVRVVLRQSGDHAIVEVHDTGCGMDADFIQNRLFRPFDSTKGLTGMGIGAYECREVVQASGGQVQVESEPQKGTVFRIMLPLSVRSSDGR